MTGSPHPGLQGGCPSGLRQWLKVVAESGVAQMEYVVDEAHQPIGHGSGSLEIAILEAAHR